MSLTVEDYRLCAASQAGSVMEREAESDSELTPLDEEIESSQDCEREASNFCVYPSFLTF